MAVYVVLSPGHSLKAGDCVIGNEYFRKEGSQQFRFHAWSENGQEDRGEVHLPLDWIRANLRLSSRDEQRESPDEEQFLQAAGFVQPPRQVQRPLNLSLAPLSHSSSRGSSSGLRRSPSFTNLAELAELAESGKVSTLGDALAMKGLRRSEGSTLSQRKLHLSFDELQPLSGRGDSPLQIASHGQPLLADKIGPLLSRKKVTGLNERATCFMRREGGGNIAVLGWDHAMVVKRLLGQYCVTHIYAHLSGESLSHPIFGHIGLSKDIERLDTSDGASKVRFKEHTCKSQSCKKACGWVRVALPKPLRVERIITFQASSCCVCILHTRDDTEMIISHMDDKPPIPVGQIYLEEFGEPRQPLYAVASILPDLGEMDKVIHSCRLVGAEPLFLRRGPLPPDDAPGMLGWSNLESGIVFPLVSQQPTFFGVIGATQVYKSAVAKGLMSHGPDHKLVATGFQQTLGWSTQGLKLDFIVKMSTEALRSVIDKLRHTQFGPVHLQLANQVGLALLSSKDDRLRGLTGKGEKDAFYAAMRALLIYGHIPDHVKDPLVKAVVELVDSVLPSLQLSFSIPLTMKTRDAIKGQIETRGK